MTKTRVNRRGRLLSLAGTALVVAALIVVVHEIGTDVVVAAVVAADPRLLAGAVLVYVASWPLRGRRYDRILTALGLPVGSLFSTQAVFVSQTANLVIPARAGDAGRAYLVNRHRGVPYATGASSLTVERIADLCAIATIGILAGIWLALGDVNDWSAWLRMGRDGTAMAAAGGVGLFSIVTAVVAVAGTRLSGPAIGLVPDRVTASIGSRLRHGSIDHFLGDLRSISGDRRLLRRIAASSLFIWSLDVLAAILVLLAVGGWNDLWVVVPVGTFAVCVGNLAKVLPVTQGGIGLYEAGFAAVVVGLSPIGAGPAVVAALLDHAIKNVVTVAGGGVAILSIR